MSSTAVNTVARRKDHKGGKIASLSILWVAVGVVLIFGIAQFASYRSAEAHQPAYDSEVVAVTDVTSGDRLQPVSAKIVSTGDMALLTSSKARVAKDYVGVWKKLELLAPPSATDAERIEVVQTFLGGLNYTMSERGGVIVSITTGDPISPDTLTCYLNGYIPDKPHLKTSCPSI